MYTWVRWTDFDGRAASIQAVEFSDDEEEKRSKSKRKGSKKTRGGDKDSPKEKKR